MTLEELLNLRGLELARADSREVLRYDGPVPTPQSSLFGSEYDQGWAVRTWHRVRHRYNDRARLVNLPIVEEYHLAMEGLLSRRPYRKITPYFSIGLPLEIRIGGPRPDDLYLLAALHLYRRLVDAAVVGPRGV